MPEHVRQSSPLTAKVLSYSTRLVHDADYSDDADRMVRLMVLGMMLIVLLATLQQLCEVKPVLKRGRLTSRGNCGPGGVGGIPAGRGGQQGGQAGAACFEGGHIASALPASLPGKLTIH